MLSDVFKIIMENDLLPIDGKWDELEKIGFHRPKKKYTGAYSNLLYRATIPSGWKKCETQDSQYINICNQDEKVCAFVYGWYYGNRTHVAIQLFDN